MKRVALVCLLAVAFVSVASAQVPTVMNYQGRLTDNSPGQNPIDATLPMEFRIYGSPMGMDLEWSESWAGGVTVTNGIFSVLLGSNGTPLPSSLFASGADRWLEIEVDGETLMPRQQLGSAGWAHQAGSALDAESLGGLPSTSWQQRVTGVCPPGSSIRVIDSAGSVVCEVDNNSGIMTEVDPSVQVMTEDAVPRNVAGTLVDGSILDTNSGVQVTMPAAFDSRVDVAGRLATNTGLIENGLFSGVLTNVAEADLPGWTPCYTATYDDPTSGPNVRDTLCTQDLVLLACRETGSSTLTVAAMGHRADVFFEVPNGGDTTHTANGVKWYYGDAYSMGYANAGTAVNRSSCDTAGDIPEDRLCWHTSGAGGFRCGATTALNLSTAWEKVAYQRPATGSHVEANLYDIRTNETRTPGDLTVQGNLNVSGTVPETDPQVSSAIVDRIPVWNGSSLVDASLGATSASLVLPANGYIDDDIFVGGIPDDYIRLSGYVDIRSTEDNYGIVLRDRDTTEYFGLTQRDGVSYLADTNSSFNYFLAGNGADATVRGNLDVQAGLGHVGTHPSYSGASYTALWREGAPDYTLLANVNHTYLNAPSPTGTIYLRAGNSSLASISGASGEFDVVGNVDVNGTALIGYEIVSAAYNVTTSAACHSHGNLTCFYGSGSVSCPVGKKVLGGGTTGSNARYGATGYSYPAADGSGWNCSSSYDLSTTDTCYAICARVGN